MANRVVSTIVAVYAVVLRTLPVDLRDDVGRELTRSLREKLEECARNDGVLRAVGRGIRELGDLVVSSVAERTARGRRRWMMRRRGGGAGVIDGLWQDLLASWRSVRRRPVLTSVVVLTMAVAIGGNVAVFGVVNGVLLRPLAYPEADRLVHMNESFRETQSKSVAYPNLVDWRERNRVFEDLAGRTRGSFTLTGHGSAQELSAQLLTANTLSVLGVEPTLGRMFTPEEESANARVVLISDALWRTLLGSDDDVLGRSITLTGEPFTVIGVLPPALEYPLSGAEIWLPITMMWAPDLTDRASHPGIVAIARMREGITRSAAQADMDRVAAALSEEHPETNREAGVNVRGLQDVVVDDSRPTLLLLQGAVILLLVIACANLVNLMLVRTLDRAREIGVRVALGVGRGRLVRQVLLEGLLLSLAGGVLGVLFAVGAVDLIRQVSPAGIPRLEGLRVGAPMLGYAALVAVLAGVVLGLVPALHAVRSSPAVALNDGGQRVGHSRGSARVRAALVVSEVALAFVLLAGAGLMTRSVHNLLDEDPGFSAESRVAVNVALPLNEYPTTQTRSAFYGQLLDRLRSLPGITGVGGVGPLPLSGGGRQRAISNDGFTSIDGSGLRVDHFTVTPDYFATMEIPLMRGREFRESDDFESRAVIVDETLAGRLWPGVDPVGKRFKLRGDESPWLEVVGVVGHVKNYGVQELSRGQYYTPYRTWVFGLWIVARTEVDPVALGPPIRDAVADLDPDVPVRAVTTLSELSRRSMALERLTTVTLLVFALMALGLAVLGLYGVVSHTVRLRTREIGIRIALGARTGRVLRRVVKEGLLLGLVGTALGILGGVLGSRTLSSLLFGVAGADPLTFSGAAAAMAVLVGLASLLPALRAARVDPVSALRED